MAQFSSCSSFRNLYSFGALEKAQPNDRLFCFQRIYGAQTQTIYVVCASNEIAYIIAANLARQKNLQEIDIYSRSIELRGNGFENEFDFVEAFLLREKAREENNQVEFEFWTNEALRYGLVACAIPDEEL